MSNNVKFYEYQLHLFFFFHPCWNETLIMVNNDIMARFLYLFSFIFWVHIFIPISLLAASSFFLLVTDYPSTLFFTGFGFFSSWINFHPCIVLYNFSVQVISFSLSCVCSMVLSLLGMIVKVVPKNITSFLLHNFPEEVTSFQLWRRLEKCL